MNKFKTIALAMLLIASACSAQIMGLGNRKVFSASAPITWTYLHTADDLCSSGTSCVVPVTATTANSVLIVSGYGGTNAYLTGCTGGGGAWVTGSSYAAYNATGGSLMVAYNITGTGGATSITCNFSATLTSPELTVSEWTRSTGAPTLDALAATNINSTSCSGSCSLSSFPTLTGSSDLLVQVLNWGSASSPSAPYVFDSLGYSIYALNSTQTTAPTIGNSGYMQSSGLAFK